MKIGIPRGCHACTMMLFLWRLVDFHCHAGCSLQPCKQQEQRRPTHAALQTARAAGDSAVALRTRNEHTHDTRFPCHRQQLHVYKVQARTSGAMKKGVPWRTPLACVRLPAKRSAMPKSVILAVTAPAAKAAAKSCTGWNGAATCIEVWAIRGAHLRGVGGLCTGDGALCTGRVGVATAAV